MTDSLEVWRFVDGKPGHENQSLGLVKALAEHVELRLHDISVEKGVHNLLNLLLGRCPQGPASQPDLLIGAGHATHLPMLACRRACGGRIVVLMKPSLPRRWFDLCIVPQHDGLAETDRVLVTQGVVNPVRACDKRVDVPTLVLLGGPSGEYAWNEQQLFEQVRAIVAAATGSVLVVGSRRTPGSTLERLHSGLSGAARVLAQSDTEAGWLASQLPHTKEVWVSEDSVSMVYEALTAAAACGLLAVPLKKTGRVSQGVRSLVQQGFVTTFDAWQKGAPLAVPDQPFNEAQRAAHWVLQHV